MAIYLTGGIIGGAIDVSIGAAFDYPSETNVDLENKA
jgi:hypothetical protein